MASSKPRSPFQSRRSPSNGAQVPGLAVCRWKDTAPGLPQADSSRTRSKVHRHRASSSGRGCGRGKQAGAGRPTVAHLAALAGISETTVRNALRECEALGLVSIGRGGGALGPTNQTRSGLCQKNRCHGSGRARVQIRTSHECNSLREGKKVAFPKRPLRLKRNPEPSGDTGKGFSAEPRRMRAGRS